MHASVLKYFVEVAQCGSVRKASERLFVAASAVNRQILKLEAELGTELFDRQPHGLHLNPAGERLLRHVQETLHGFQLLRTELDALKGERTGHIKVAAMDSFFEDVLPSAVEDFMQVYPAVTYTVTATQPMDVAPLVASGRADVGLSFVTRLPPGAAATALANLPLGVVMAPGHPLAARSAVSLRELAGYPFIRSSQHPVIGQAHSPAFAEFWDAMEPAAVCNSTPMIKRLIGAGRGISCFSKTAFIAELTAGTLVWRPFDLPELREMQVGIIVPSHRALPTMTQHFVGRLTQRLAQLERAAAAV